MVNAERVQILFKDIMASLVLICVYSWRKLP